MAEYKVLEWNINMQSKRIEIPNFVSDSILKQEADIVILTEFVHFSKKNNKGDKKDYFYSSEEFLNQTFKNKGYDYVTSMSSLVFKANDVLIAWKSNRFKKNEKKQVNCFTCDINNPNVPNFLTVNLIENSTDKEICIAGVRITMTSYDNPKNYPYLNNFYSHQAKLRYDEMNMIYSVLNKITTQKTKILIAGDFNNYRRFTIQNEWNINRLACEKGDYCVYTPYGNSWDGKDSIPPIPPAPEDHFITKNCEMKEYEYNRDFIKDNEIYKNGSLKNISSPNPDHAMLIGTLVID